MIDLILTDDGFSSNFNERFNGTVALHVTVIGSEACYMKEASKIAGVMLKIAGLYPWIDSQSISGKILSHLDVNKVFVTLKLRYLHYL